MNFIKLIGKLILIIVLSYVSLMVLFACLLYLMAQKMIPYPCGNGVGFLQRCQTNSFFTIEFFAIIVIIVFLILCAFFGRMFFYDK